MCYKNRKGGSSNSRLKGFIFTLSFSYSVPFFFDSLRDFGCIDRQREACFLGLTTRSNGQHQVVGPSQPVVVTVGDDIILPCHLRPAKNVSDMTVEWARPDLNPRFVHVWRDGVELESKKHPSYKGRTSVSIDKLKHGDMSLTLSRVTLSDGGQYKCFIPGLGHSLIQLVVGAVSSPFIVSINITSRRVALQCESAGWYPEPEVLWLDGEGKLLSAGPTETVRGPDDLYTVSSRVTVEKRHSNSFTCRVQQRNINQARETATHISGHRQRFKRVKTSHQTFRRKNNDRGLICGQIPVV
ncbi:butyrophilin subfamily 2 member A2-like isoform X1 [Epinephelus fuscoguttatus]|uniref:butyrophilin subfamily 2 member A2-like isoform X1 n=1 Tax=Epinephelus fuscoguttatus TaxID=293821 RepID=UPI0020D1C3D5|nr:butyrophilin subfamily 2 member A2-like isoform X1 [Epinephelus fuscoguttatus]